MNGVGDRRGERTQAQAETAQPARFDPGLRLSSLHAAAPMPTGHGGDARPGKAVSVTLGSFNPGRKADLGPPEKFS